MNLLAAAVHTTGINWQSISVIAGTIVVVTGSIGAYIRRAIKTSVDNLASVLVERLETKDNVARLTTRVAVLEAHDQHASRRRQA